MARGLCNTHWTAWRRSVGASFRPRYGRTVERFWSKVNRRGDDDCWYWTGTIEATGYGQFYTGAMPRIVKAHRFAYELLVGVIPDGLVLNHTCHDPASCTLRNQCPHRRCVNPAHLELVTPLVNTLRSGGITAAEHRRDTCIHGHPLSGANLIVRPDGSRRCRECKNESARRAYASLR